MEGVVNELNLMSYYYARELQLETRQPYRKDFSDGTNAYDLPYEESPPTLLLALNLTFRHILVYFPLFGFISIVMAYSVLVAVWHYELIRGVVVEVGPCFRIHR